MFQTRQRHHYAADRITSIDTDWLRLFYAQDDPSLLESDPFVSFFEMALAEEGTSTITDDAQARITSADIITSFLRAVSALRVFSTPPRLIQVCITS